jgi:hypothetical protein
VLAREFQQIAALAQYNVMSGASARA